MEVWFIVLWSGVTCSYSLSLALSLLSTMPVLLDPEDSDPFPWSSSPAQLPFVKNLPKKKLALVDALDELSSAVMSVAEVTVSRAPTPVPVNQGITFQTSTSAAPYTHLLLNQNYLRNQPREGSNIHPQSPSNRIARSFAQGLIMSP